MPEPSDKNITCMDCRTPFVFDAGEQAFFQSKGYTDPKRCQKCRQARKQSQSKPSDNR